MAKEKSRFSNQINIKNRRASYEFSFLDTFVAGMQLRGTEIKSIREGKAQLQDAYCFFNGGELYIKQMHIAQFTEGSYNNHITDRERKLLLNKRLIGHTNKAFYHRKRLCENRNCFSKRQEAFR
jgi:SsrA-binding protein